MMTEPLTEIDLSEVFWNNYTFNYTFHLDEYTLNTIKYNNFPKVKLLLSTNGVGAENITVFKKRLNEVQQSKIAYQNKYELENDMDSLEFQIQ